MLYSCFPRYFWLGTSKNYSTSSLPDGQPGRMAGLYGRILDKPHYNGRDIPKSTAYAARFTQK